jgi:isoquinoline 1-oxidoreductase beta subunit
MFLQNLLREKKTSRRNFLLGASAISGGFLVGLLKAPALAQQAGAARAPINPLQGYVRIGTDNTVTAIAAHMDMGQGIYHATATLVAEEIGADWGQMRVTGGSGNTALYGNLEWGGAVQGTGGSTGLASSYLRYRKAGAAAREMLVAAAADEWKVPAGEIRVEKGVVSHRSGRQATFGQLAAKAATMPVPADPKLKDAKDFVFIGNEKLMKIDSRGKTTGQQQFTADLNLPGMLTAVMIHPPLFGATVRSVDAAQAKSVPGVVDVITIPRGVAVVARGMWAALKGREKVSVQWDESKAEKRSTDQIMAEYRQLAAGPGKAIAREDGNFAAAIASASKTLEASFEFPYLAHAALEPLNAVVRRNGEGIVEVWGGHQMPDIYQNIVAGIAGTTPDKVRMHVMKTGGGFGRRAVIDADVIAEATAIARAMNFSAPIKVQWTREEDTRGGRYRPAYVHTLKAGLDDNGNLVAWHNHIVGQSIVAGTPFEGGLVKNGVDKTSVEGSSNLPYAIPNQKVELTTTQVGVPVLWWRAVGSTHTAYAVEAFLDEVAEAAGKDPVAFRLAMLGQSPRHAAVLRLAAEKAGWNQPLPAGRFRGVALAESFDTIVAQIAEISVRDGRVKVEKVVCALDCGIVVNPDNLRAQIEGGIGFGLGAVLKSRLTLDAGKVVEGNFDGYEVLRFDEMPRVEVHVVTSGEKPTGVGEPGVPPIGPAVANAYYAATRKRIRVLPFSQAGAA